MSTNRLSHNVALLPVVLVVVLVLKLYPTLITGLPFSIDSWPLIRQVELLVENPNTIIWDDTLFDGYNNHWPGSIIYGAIGSIVLGCRPIDFMRIMAPVINGLGVLVLIVLVKRITRSNYISYISGLLIGIMPSILVFTSGVTKETFTHILFYSLLLSVTLESTILLVLSTSIVIYHHLTSFIALLVLLERIVISKAMNIMGYFNGRQTSIKPVVILFIVILVHYLLVGSVSLKIGLSFHSLLKLFLYLFGFTVFAIMILTIKLIRQKNILLLIIVSELALLAVVVYSTMYSIASGIPPLGIEVLLYGFILLLSPIALYVYMRNDRILGEARYLVYGWITATFSLLFYSIFGGEAVFSSIPHRIANFLIMALALAYAVALARTSKKLIVFIVLGIIILNSFIVVQRIIQGSDEVSYYWRFYQEEYLGMKYVRMFYNNTIIGDTKVWYLAKYFDIRVFHIYSVTSSLENRVLKDILLFLYNDNFKRGFLTSLATIDSGTILPSITSTSDRILSNNYVVLLWVK